MLTCRRGFSSFPRRAFDSEAGSADLPHRPASARDGHAGSPTKFVVVLSTAIWELGSKLLTLYPAAVCEQPVSHLPSWAILPP